MCCGSHLPAQATTQPNKHPLKAEAWQHILGIPTEQTAEQGIVCCVQPHIITSYQPLRSFVPPDLAKSQRITPSDKRQPLKLYCCVS
ncbi:hypothetical protein ACHAXN_001546 [Cyclotella atomus]